MIWVTRFLVLLHIILILVVNMGCSFWAGRGWAWGWVGGQTDSYPFHRNTETQWTWKQDTHTCISDWLILINCSDHQHHHHHHHHHHPHHQEANMEEVPLKPPKPKKPVADGVAIIDCTPYCRPLGLTSPWFRRVWFVKDICGLVSNTPEPLMGRGCSSVGWAFFLLPGSSYLEPTPCFCLPFYLCQLF